MLRMFYGPNSAISTFVIHLKIFLNNFLEKEDAPSKKRKGNDESSRRTLGSSPVPASPFTPPLISSHRDNASADSEDTTVDARFQGPVLATVRHIV